MTTSRVDAVAAAVLYEGYALYPYRPSSVKSQRRFNFGVLAPKAVVEQEDRGYLWQLGTECIVEGGAGTRLSLTARFLQLAPRESAAAEPAPEPWCDAVERVVAVPEAALAVFAPPGGVRRCFRFDGLAGEVDAAVEPLPSGGYRVGVRLANTSVPGASASWSHNQVLEHACLSTHVVLRVVGGAFVSAIDPPEAWRDAVAGCTNTGLWPVLAGEPGERDVMLASPIILYDYPEIAAESPGDLFDGAEIDEILTLRILTLTDAEKDEMRRADARTRRLLERTEALTPAHLGRLHGMMRAVSDPRERGRR